jgi:hypothetical protein
MSPSVSPWPTKPSWTRPHLAALLGWHPWPSKAHHECIACRFEWRSNRGDLDALLAWTHRPWCSRPQCYVAERACRGTSCRPRAIMGPWEEAPWLRRSGAASWS